MEVNKELKIELKDVIISHKDNELYEVLIPDVIGVNLKENSIILNTSLSRMQMYNILKYLWQNIESLSCYEFPLTYESSKEQRVSKIDINTLGYLEWDIN